MKILVTFHFHGNNGVCACSEQVQFPTPNIISVYALYVKWG